METTKLDFKKAFYKKIHNVLVYSFKPVFF